MGIHFCEFFEAATRTELPAVQDSTSKTVKKHILYLLSEAQYTSFCPSLQESPRMVDPLHLHVSNSDIGDLSATVDV